MTTEMLRAGSHKLAPTNSLLGVDVLRPRMKLWISGECDGTLVVSIDDGGCCRRVTLSSEFGQQAPQPYSLLCGLGLSH